MIEEKTKAYFNINADCFLVRGAKRGALYNLTTGDVYSIDPVAIRVIEGCEAHRALDEITLDVREAGADKVHAFLENMANEGMGSFSGRPERKGKIDLERTYTTLDFLWLELREDCNLRCRHCYCMSSPAVSEVDRLTHDDWIRLLGEGRDVGCRTVQFIGGEPLLYGDGLFDLAGHASLLGYTTVELFSNLTFLRDAWLEKIVDLNIKVAVSVYAKRPEIHDIVTTVPGSFERTMRNIRRLKERGVQPRFALTVMKQNQDYLEETLAFLREMGNPTPGFDLVRPSGRGNDDEIIPDKLSKKAAYRTQAEFMRTDRETFIRRYNGNGCWQGKLAVSSTGFVHPCIMSREGDSGNVREQSLKEIIGEALRKYWDLSYDRIEVCRDCEYRYACKDCRPVTIGATGELTAKSIHCSYNPYRGEWIDG